MASWLTGRDRGDREERREREKRGGRKGEGEGKRFILANSADRKNIFLLGKDGSRFHYPLDDRKHYPLGKRKMVRLVYDSKADLPIALLETKDHKWSGYVGKEPYDVEMAKGFAKSRVPFYFKRKGQRVFALVLNAISGDVTMVRNGEEETLFKFELPR